MADPRSGLARRGEAAAALRLAQEGYRILETNHRSPLGEIDLIAREGDTLVFVEVKTRRGRAGSPKEAVTPRKQRRLSLLALAYLKAHGRLDRPARFDVVAVTWGEDGPEIEIVRNAFDLCAG